MRERSDPGGRRHVGLRALAAAAALATSIVSDREPDPAAPCRVLAATVRIYEGSRLFPAPDERLELSRGRALGCDSPRAQPVLAALGDALFAWPVTLSSEPLRVHLDPALPERHAPLAAIEVHVTSREVLVASSAFGTLPRAAWRHELLHTIAAAPPPLPAHARRLWLTLEEGVVGYLARAAGDGGAALPMHDPVDPIDALAGERGLAPAGYILPLFEWLASPAYDPHPLATGLARALERAAPQPRLGTWLDCLSAPLEHRAERSLAISNRRDEALAGALAEVFAAFMGRCPADVRTTISTVSAGWWQKPAKGLSPAAHALGKAAAGGRKSR